MKWKRSLLIVGAVLLLSGTCHYQWRHHIDDMINVEWNPNTRILDWGRGSVIVPRDFDYERVDGIDTEMGKFNSTDRQFSIEFDIGELAGEHAGGRGSIQTLRAGSRVISGQLRDKEGVFSKAAFPDNGCANFYAFAAEEARLEALDSLVRSFQPHNRTPAWIHAVAPGRHPFRMQSQAVFLAAATCAGCEPTSTQASDRSC